MGTICVCVNVLAFAILSFSMVFCELKCMKFRIILNIEWLINHTNAELIPSNQYFFRLTLEDRGPYVNTSSAACFCFVFVSLCAEYAEVQLHFSAFEFLVQYTLMVCLCFMRMSFFFHEIISQRWMDKKRSRRTQTSKLNALFNLNSHFFRSYVVLMLQLK